MLANLIHQGLVKGYIAHKQQARGRARARPSRAWGEGGPTQMGGGHPAHAQVHTEGGGGQQRPAPRVRAGGAAVRCAVTCGERRAGGGEGGRQVVVLKKDDPFRSQS